MASNTIAQSRDSNKPNPTYKNLSSSRNSSSPSHTPFFELTFTNTTVGHATANMSTRLCRSSYEEATVSTWTHAPHTLHCMTGKQSPSSNCSNGQGHGQAPQLRAIMNSSKYKNMEPFSRQQIWAIDKWHQRTYQEPYQHY